MDRRVAALLAMTASVTVAVPREDGVGRAAARLTMPERVGVKGDPVYRSQTPHPRLARPFSSARRAWPTTISRSHVPKPTCETAPAARPHRSQCRRSARHAKNARCHPRVVRTLRLRAGRNAVHRIHRCARQVSARSGSAERRRVLVPGRRRAMAVAALRPHRAARALCRREFRQAAETLSLVSRRHGVPQREARPRPLPSVHAVRRRHRRRILRRGRCGNLHDGGGHVRTFGIQARRIRHQGQQSKDPRWRDGGDRAWWRREWRQASDGLTRDRQT